jgi:Ca2+-binding RTX toxin-like protein
MRVLLISLITGVAGILLFSLDQPSWAELIFCQLPPAPVCEGTSGDGVIVGQSGNIIFGKAGDDYIETHGSSASYIYGDDGNDRLIGSYGNDGLYGGAGNDYYDGGHGSDSIAESLWVRAGTLVFSNDVISGGEGDDYIDSRLGSDRIHGGPGNDRIYPNGYDRDFSFDIVNCGSDTGDRVLYLYSGDGDTTVNCEFVTDLDR